ncbi:DUF397 domain-containing protein [Streptomyces oceani]|uniref:Toxin n=1 Tax=Streptomyces oceani TaxID=1075402 RepID=A0A1E7KJL8_9ACTN|nr:DUF397 domain-containing protein [Streptomyces oceani]OEV04083.1 toxin [Streptomyces oceani]
MSGTDPSWFKSSYSGTSGDNCVEVAIAPATVSVRDSKEPHSPRLDLSPTAWAAFVSYASGRD